MISYFKLFVFGLFPPALILLALLLIPFPPRVAKSVIGLCDAILFARPHPHVPLSLFWVVIFVSTATFLVHMDAVLTIGSIYRGTTTGLNAVDKNNMVQDRDRVLVKLLAEERNTWIAGSNLLLWIGLHRYRALLKSFYRVEEEKSLVLEEKRRVLQLFSQAQMDTQAVASAKQASLSAPVQQVEMEKDEARPASGGVADKKKD